MFFCLENNLSLHKMMESLSLQEIIIKKIIFFRLNKELNYTETKDILKTSDTRKIHLTITINFIFLKDNEEECAMYSKSDNTETMINVEADEVMIELFKSPKNRHQNNLESTKGSDFVFDYVHLLYYKCHKSKSWWII